MLYFDFMLFKHVITKRILHFNRVNKLLNDVVDELILKHFLKNYDSIFDKQLLSVERTIPFEMMHILEPFKD